MQRVEREERRENVVRGTAVTLCHKWKIQPSSLLLFVCSIFTALFACLFTYLFGDLLYNMVKKLVVHLSNYTVIDELIEM